MKTTAILPLIALVASVASQNCGSSLKPEKLVVVGVWKRSFDNATAQYRISDEDLSVRGYERAEPDKASATVMLARHPEGCVVTDCGVRLSAMMQVNGAILHTDHRMIRMNDSTMNDIADEFYCAEKNNSCGADVPIYRLVKHSLTGPHYAYSFDNIAQSLPGYEKEFFPLCFAWRQTPSVVLFNSSDDSVCLTLSETSHGRITYSNNQLNVFSVGTTATLECNHGYAGIGASNIVCTKSGWYPKEGLGTCVEQKKTQLLVAASQVQADEQPSCSIPTTSNGNIVYSANVAASTLKTSVPTATRATVLCNIGYVPTTSTTSSKCVDGQWEPALPSCISLVDLKCPILPAPKNGELVFSNSSHSPYGIDSIISLKCDRNFFGMGNVTSSCTSNGWDQKIGRCEPVGIRRLSQSQWNRKRRQVTSGVGCSAMADSANGNLLYMQSNPSVPYSAGTSVYLMCNLAYSLSGSVSSICTNGAWTPAIGQCTSALPLGQTTGSCSAIATPVNGTVTYTSIGTYPSGTIATLTCNLMNTVSGSSTSTCTSGIWTPTIGSCIYSSTGTGTSLTSACLNPTVLNGIITYSQGSTFDVTRPYLTTATLTCNSGYTLSGTSQSTCTSGTFTPTLGTCNLGGSTGGSTATCTNPTVLNGMITYSQGSTFDMTRPALTVATLTCNIGYTLSGTSSSTCTNGVFTPTLGTCNFGTGTTTLQCTAMIAPLGGSVVYSSGGTMGPFPSGTTVTGSCTNGGAITGSSTATCSNGFWSPTFLGTCSLIGGSTTGSCSALTVPSGAQATYSPFSLSTTNFTSGTVATVTCTTGGTLLGTSTCTSGIWSPAITSTCTGGTGTTCTSLTRPIGESVTYDGTTSFATSFSTGTIARVTCSNGTQLGQSTCYSGTWTPAITTTCSGSSTAVGSQCIGVIVPTNAQVTYSDGSMVLHSSGATATLTCLNSAIISGNSYSTCSNGVWTPTLGSCTTTGTGTGPCYTPPLTPTGATLTYSSGYFAPWTAGSTATMTCPSGQTASGTTITYCTNSAWSPALGTCGTTGTVGQGCTPLTAFSGTLTNGRMTYTPQVTATVPIGTVVNIVCYSGYSLTGSSVSSCTSSGWSPSAIGSCVQASTSLLVKKSCPAMPVVSFGNVSYSEPGTGSFPSGTTVTLRCDTNVSTTGGATSATCNNGVWLPASLATCQSALKEMVLATCPLGIAPVLAATIEYSNNSPLGPWPVGTAVTATCQSGYVPNGIMTALCANGVWTPSSLGTCDLLGNELGGTSCGALGDILSGTLVYSALGLGPYPSGTSVTVLCNIGTTLSGQPSAVCTNGVWNPLPGTCINTLLRKPPMKSNSITLSAADSPKNETSDDTPRALSGMTCPPPVAPAFGEITFSGLSVKGSFDDGTTAALRCNLGYKPTGPSFSTCRKGSFRPIIGRCSNGVESSSSSSSSSICVPLSPPKNSRVVYIQSGTSLDFDDGTTALLYCEEGFAVTGVATLQCQGGQWEPSTGFGMCDSI